MKIGKKILFSLLSLFLIWQSYQLAESLYRTTAAELDTGQIIMVAFMINLFITGIFAFPGFVFPTHQLLGKAYFSIRNENRLKRIYKVLGVDYFKYLLLFTFWGREKNRKKYFNGTKSGLNNFNYQSLQSETGHFLSFINILLFSVLLIFKAYIFLAVLTILINILANFYPVILQRYHRMRIKRVLDKLIGQKGN